MLFWWIEVSCFVLCMEIEEWTELRHDRVMLGHLNTRQNSARPRFPATRPGYSLQYKRKIKSLVTLQVSLDLCPRKWPDTFSITRRRGPWMRWAKTEPSSNWPCLLWQRLSYDALYQGKYCTSCFKASKIMSARVPAGCINLSHI